MAQQQKLQPEPQRTSAEPQRYDEQTLRQTIQLADRLQAEHKESLFHAFSEDEMPFAILQLISLRHS